MGFKYQQVFVLTDNPYLYRQFLNLLERKGIPRSMFTFACSKANKSFQETDNIEGFNIKKDYASLANYDLVFSLHCKQLFPKELVSAKLCINIHPGLNPHNRGWFPQVFSILNGKPLGATLHLIDEEVDHGAIIAQKQVSLYEHDTSLTAYNRVLEAELALLDEFLPKILEGTFETHLPAEEGNLNLLADFNKLCEINLEEQVTFGQAINRLRALTHGHYKNAYFRDSKGNKVFVSIDMAPENSPEAN
ncbi:MAG: dTDP-4-amino-4,6-dideoxyglucose formyltransferase [Chitinophagales bacterium]|nr:dTDP-4-amino-4,6-dideoxyglucose formyltransferase [Chitinophagales bacterium]